MRIQGICVSCACAIMAYSGCRIFCKGGMCMCVHVCTCECDACMHVHVLLWHIQDTRFFVRGGGVQENGHNQFILCLLPYPLLGVHYLELLMLSPWICHYSCVRVCVYVYVYVCMYVCVRV